MTVPGQHLMTAFLRFLVPPSPGWRQRPLGRWREKVREEEVELEVGRRRKAWEAVEAEQWRRVRKEPYSGGGEEGWD